MEFKLTETSRVKVPIKRGTQTRVEEAYTYMGPQGEVVKFSADPENAFSFLLLPGTNAAGKKVAKAVLDSFCDAGLKSKGAFEDAIKVITVS